MVREERQGCCVWLGSPPSFCSWLAPPDDFYVVCWKPHESWRIWVYRFLAFQQLWVLIWLCSHCVTLATSYQVSLCAPFPLSMKSVLLYPCYHSHDAPAKTEMPCRVGLQWQDTSLVFLRVSYPSLPALGWCVTSQNACSLAQRPGSDVLLLHTHRTLWPFLVSWADWHRISFERKQTRGFLIFFSFAFLLR